MNKHNLFEKLQRQGIKQVKNRAKVLIIYENRQQNIRGFFIFYSKQNQKHWTKSNNKITCRGRNKNIQRKIFSTFKHVYRVLEIPNVSFMSLH